MAWKETSVRGRQLIERFEGRRNKSYRCLRGVWTCGIGSTGPDVGPDTYWTDEQVDERFIADLRRFEIAVNKLVTAPINQHQFDALVALCFNIGIAAFRASTLVRLLNKELYHNAGQQFGKWVFVNGEVAAGLVKRREAEHQLFMQRDVKAQG